MTLFLLLALGALMRAARSFVPQAGPAGASAGTTVAFGYLLLSGFLMGSLFASIGLPRLTGYLATGLVAGPSGLNLITEQMVVNLRIFNGIAIALIALTAGGEMEWKSIKPQLKTIRSITLIAVVGTVFSIGGAAYLMRGHLPFMAELTVPGQLAAAAVLGVTMVAGSPAVAVALREEMQADGPLTRTVLGTVVLADIAVIILFAVVSSMAHAVFGRGVEGYGVFIDLSRELVGSAIAGVLIGLLVALFLKKVARGGALFILTVGFLVAEVGQRINLDPLMIALAMGIFIRNATAVGDRLLHTIETGSLPVYVAFFAVAGATIELGTLLTVGIPAIVLVVVRGVSLLAGSRLATRLSNAPLMVQRYAGFGLLPQAGLALALALLFRRTFPSFGEAASMLVFGVVAINELAAPIIFRLALVKSGESGKLQRVRSEAPEVSAVPTMS